MYLNSSIAFSSKGCFKSSEKKRKYEIKCINFFITEFSKSITINLIWFQIFFKFEKNICDN